jgi:hypothetical protein
MTVDPSLEDEFGSLGNKPFGWLFPAALAKMAIIVG